MDDDDDKAGSETRKRKNELATPNSSKRKKTDSDTTITRDESDVYAELLRINEEAQKQFSETHKAIANTKLKFKESKKFISNFLYSMSHFSAVLFRVLCDLISEYVVTLEDVSGKLCLSDVPTFSDQNFILTNDGVVYRLEFAEKKKFTRSIVYKCINFTSTSTLFCVNYDSSKLFTFHNNSVQIVSLASGNIESTITFGQTKRKSRSDFLTNFPHRFNPYVIRFITHDYIGRIIVLLGYDESGTPTILFTDLPETTTTNPVLSTKSHGSIEYTNALGVTRHVSPGHANSLAVDCARNILYVGGNWTGLSGLACYDFNRQLFRFVKLDKEYSIGPMSCLLSGILLANMTSESGWTVTIDPVSGRSASLNPLGNGLLYAPYNGEFYFILDQSTNQIRCCSLFDLDSFNPLYIS